jgi:uncharacterized protein (UPF0276 family)
MSGTEAERGTTPRSLGVGLTYQDGLQGFVEGNLSCLDYLEVVPDSCWYDRGMGEGPRYVDNPDLVSLLDTIQSQLPLVAHSIGQSIGSADRFNRGHLNQIVRWHQRYAFPWHSDHLSYHLVEHGGINVGFTMPLPRDHATLRLLARRVAAIRRHVSAPFLLETNVYYMAFPDDELGEAEFLNRLCAESGCGLLLDLHNIYTNSRNHHCDANALLEQLNLSNVVEVHIAGGMEHAGFYLDAHSGLTPEPVWNLLDAALPRLDRLCGITFEIFEDWIKDVSHGQLREELVRMRDAWNRRPGARKQ